jgi:hypothetical protein
LRTRRIILTAVTLVLAVVGLAPIVVMFARSLILDGGFSLECYRKLLTTEAHGNYSATAWDWPC